LRGRRDVYTLIGDGGRNMPPPNCVPTLTRSPRPTVREV
jgi:hypothetical protein